MPAWFLNRFGKEQFGILAGPFSSATFKVDRGALLMPFRFCSQVLLTITGSRSAYCSMTVVELSHVYPDLESEDKNVF